MTRRCSKCKQEKSIKDFYNSQPNWCKSCCAKYSKLRWEKHKKKIKAKNKDYYKKYKEKWKNYRLKKRYNITVADYNELLCQQKGCCAICGQKETSKNKWGLCQLAVDHDHNTGKVRGLLCTKCNLILGLAKDNIDILFKAINYLKF